MSLGRGIARSVMWLMTSIHRSNHPSFYSTSARFADSNVQSWPSRRNFLVRPNAVSPNFSRRTSAFRHCRRYLRSQYASKSDQSKWSGRVLLYAGVGEAILLSSNTPVISEGHRKQIHDEMVLNIKRGILFLREEKFREAEDILHLALAGARQIGEARGEVYILDLLANLYFEERKYEQAESIFKEVLKRELALGKPEESEGIVEVSAKLARIYGVTNQIDKARAGFDYCLNKMESLMTNLTEEKKGEVVDLFLKVLQWGSEFLLSAEDKAEDSLLEATEMIENGLEKVKQLEQTGSEAYQTLASNLSTLYSWQDRAEDAVAVMKETIKLAVVSEHWSLSHFYINLAQIYAQNGDVSSAKEAANKAMETAKRTKDPAVEKDIRSLKEELEKKMSELAMK